MRKWLSGLAAVFAAALLGCGEAPVGSPPAPAVKTEVIKHKDGTTEIRSTVAEP